jgi:mannose-6-phosphate isomerase
MTIEHAHAHFLPKPWGVRDVRPWSTAGQDGIAIGEIWYERTSSVAVAPSLLLKLLFTSQPLSIQVHPDDAYAQSMGLPNGKAEAWYVLSATSDAKIALGLKRRLNSQQFRHAIDDGSISELVAWQVVCAGDTIFVPAGTIHAIGAGIVIAEIQQRSDATFRLFDHGRERELHIEKAIAVADPGPPNARALPTRLTDARMLLTSNSFFTFERVDLAPNSTWWLEAKQETWLLVVDGSARVGSLDLAVGDAVFAQSDRVNIHTGTGGFAGLVAYTGGSAMALLQCANMETVQ